MNRIITSDSPRSIINEKLALCKRLDYWFESSKKASIIPDEKADRGRRLKRKSNDNPRLSLLSSEKKIRTEKGRTWASNDLARTKGNTEERKIQKQSMSTLYRTEQWKHLVILLTKRTCSREYLNPVHYIHRMK